MLRKFVRGLRRGQGVNPRQSEATASVRDVVNGLATENGKENAVIMQDSEQTAVQRDQILQQNAQTAILPDATAIQ